MSNFGFNFNYGFYPLTVQNLLTPTTITNNFVVKVYPYWFKQMTVSWTIPVDWGNCLFDVYRGPGEEGPWTKLNQTPINGNFFKDITTLMTSKNITESYIVDAILPANAGRIQSNPTDLQSLPRTWIDLRRVEIQRREWLLLTRFVGVKSLVFRKKNYGLRCSVCWNADTQRIMQDHCTTCMGTSFEGGYFPPYTTYIQYEQTPEDLEFQAVGKIESSTIKGWTIAIPEYHDLDIVIRTSDWAIFRIDQNVKTELVTYPVRQILQLRELAKNDVEWNLIQNVSTEDYPNAYKS